MYQLFLYILITTCNLFTTCSSQHVICLNFKKCLGLRAQRKRKSNVLSEALHNCQFHMGNICVSLCRTFVLVNWACQVNLHSCGKFSFDFTEITPSTRWDLTTTGWFISHFPSKVQIWPSTDCSVPTFWPTIWRHERWRYLAMSQPFLAHSVLSR